MNGRALLDSNIIIDIAKENLDVSNINGFQSYSISVITYMETLGYSFGSTDEKDKIESILSCFEMVYLDEAIVKSVIEIRSKNKIKLPDAIIAATANVQNSTLLTRNIKDFDGIATLLKNPYL